MPSYQPVSCNAPVFLCTHVSFRWEPENIGGKARDIFGYVGNEITPSLRARQSVPATTAMPLHYQMEMEGQRLEKY